MYLGSNQQIEWRLSIQIFQLCEQMIFLSIFSVIDQNVDVERVFIYLLRLDY